jgi:hypothetical protein
MSCRWQQYNQSSRSTGSARAWAHRGDAGSTADGAVKEGGNHAETEVPPVAWVGGQTGLCHTGDGGGEWTAYGCNVEGLGFRVQTRSNGEGLGCSQTYRALSHG